MALSDATDSQDPTTNLPRKIRENLVLAWRGLRLAWDTSARLASVMAALTLLSAFMAPFMAYTGKLIVDAVLKGSRDDTIRYVAWEFALIVLSSATQRTLFLVRTLLGNRLGMEVNSQILAKAISVDLAQMEDSEFYDKMNRARMEASSRSLSLVTDAFQLIQNGLTLVGYISLLFAYSAWAVGAMVLASLPATISEMRFSQTGFRLYNWRSPQRRKMSYMEYVLANDTHAKEVRVLGLGATFFARFRGLANQFYAEDRALARQRTAWSVALSLLSSLAFYGCYLVIALSAARREISLGSLTLYVVAFRQGQQAFQSCLSAIGGMYEHNLYLSNLFEFLAIPLAHSAPRASRALPPGAPARGIFVQGLGFQYPGKDKWVLEDVNLVIPPGQSVAIVGSNGAGKSTLIKLLCGLYQPTVGHIWIDGKEVQAWDARELRNRMSVVFQDFNKYQLSVQENVGVGQIDAVEVADQVLRALDRGGADDFVAELPEGLQTSLGSWFKGGRELSGGQWQKVAISRAFMREGADILILDEPTAALDPEAESRAFQKFQELIRGKTSLVISHRFPLARLADHVVVMEKGKIIEEGTHVQLMQAAGKYATLFALQAQGYFE
jgi:ATP-binding cassette subfamily B protein